MSLLMDALKKAENAKQEAGSGNSAKTSEREYSALSIYASEKFENALEVASNSSQSAGQDEKNVFSAKAVSNARNRNKNIVIVTGSGVVFLLLIGAYAYYQFISDSLQKNTNNAVLPVLRQQPQIARKILPESQVSSQHDIQVDRQSKNSLSRSNVVELPKQRREKQVVAATVVKKNSSPISEKSISSQPGAISIKRQRVPDNIYQLLTQAYSAYQSGSDREAVSYYGKVLKLESNNRDALLGLAAISVRNKQFEKARDTYIALLENSPKDSVALSGLLNIQSNVDPIKSEIKIKLLLDSEPGSAHLLFTLGVLYASQQRWVDAQKAFFKAHSSDNQNADFAYNLAVSLDQLEQREAALKFYRIALEIVKQQPISFKVNDVMHRISVLLEVSGG
ncbi:MAG: tetratricopeptide repeat protein [Gammaproteobacteria bacterium]|nr:tetratricopeptide repeat protein [Gammaproteobacteria bacterium]